MNTDRLEELLAMRESETLEFKASLSSGAQREGIESLVAFANTAGGSVLFGVRNDGLARGVEIGANTLENLANRVKDHTYPSLPVHIETAEDSAGNIVLVVEAPRDKPPVVGVYMCSNKPIHPDEGAEAGRLQAYRRVGRTNQKEDFMRLRGTLPSDPRLRLMVRNVYTYGDDPPSVTGSVWTEDDSGTAHQILLSCEPPVCQSESAIADLPFSELHSAGSSTRLAISESTLPVNKNVADFDYSCPGLLAWQGQTIRLTATYKDDWGLTWESARDFTVGVSKEGDRELVDLVDSGNFARRIVGFPPKVLPS